MEAPGDGYVRALARPARRAAGAYYTPAALVARVVDEVLAALGEAGDAPAVLDPACGDGRFLAAVRARLPRARLVGVERDAAAAALARAAVPEAEIRVGCALTGGLLAAGEFDAVVGNPPYVRSVRLKQADPALWRALRASGMAATAHGEWDLYAAFVERSLEWVRAGGEIGLVVPSRWLTARAAARLRGLLAARRAVRRVVDFGARQVMEGPTTYTCLLFMRGAGAAGAAGTGVSVERDGGERGQVPWRALGEGPWVLTGRAEARQLERWRAAGPPLGEVARIVKGAGSNADGVFLVASDAAEGLGEPVRMRCLRGRDVRAFAATSVRDAILPYAGGRLLPWAELSRLAPGAARHLRAHRAELEARERGRFTGERFHAWGRPQNLAFLLDRRAKVVVPDAAREGRAALDRDGLLVMDTAYAIRPLDERAVPIGLLLAILNSPLVAAWLRATGIPLRGDYFRMKTAYLASLPILDPRSRAAQHLAAAALAARPADAAPLGESVMAAYGGLAAYGGRCSGIRVLGQKGQ